MAVDTIRDFIAEVEMQVYIVVFDKAALAVAEKLFSDLIETSKIQ